jgi:hypothetical protein
MSTKKIEQGVPFIGIKTAIRSSIGITGIQGTNQVGLFFDDDTQRDV